MGDEVTRVLVCGGRDYKDRDRVRQEMRKLGMEFGEPLIIQGGSTGADQLARDFADACGWPCVTMHAQWDAQGRAAGPIRNRRMLDLLKPHLVLAFPGGQGTYMTVTLAQRMGIPVRIVPRKPSV